MGGYTFYTNEDNIYSGFTNSNSTSQYAKAETKDDEELNTINNKVKSNSEIFQDTLSGILNVKNSDNATEENSQYNRGIFAVFFNKITSSGSFLFGMLNAFNQLLLGSSASTFMLLIIGAVITFAIYYLVQNIMRVGRNRFFLESQKYSKTGMRRMLFPYTTKKVLHMAWVLFTRDFFLFLWNFTIIGGIIKHYSYYMIPYILAENPSISRKEAFKISRTMMNGHKWETFVLELSFWGWQILQPLTFNLINVFYVDSYYEYTFANYYLQLRDEYKQNKLAYYELLNDDLLVGEPCDESYPEGKITKTSKFKIDYEKDYSLKNYILFFFTFAILEWIWEVALHLFSYGIFINRGTMFGPWLPIYGFGGVLILFCLKPFRKKPWLTFILAMVLCAILEYSTAWYLETFMNAKWWDYSGYFMNLQGRICLEGILVFGLGGCGFTYLIAPILNTLYNKINSKITTTICIILVTLFATDIVYSHFNPNVGKGITDTISSTNMVTNAESNKTGFLI